MEQGGAQGHSHGLSCRIQHMQGRVLYAALLQLEALTVAGRLVPDYPKGHGHVKHEAAAADCRSSRELYLIESSAWPAHVGRVVMG